MPHSPRLQVTPSEQQAANNTRYERLTDQEEGNHASQADQQEGKEDDLTLGQRISASMHRFYRRNFGWLLYLKILPSMLLLGTFGRRPITIAKLAAPKVVESFAAFIGPLLGPIIFLSLIDSLFIASCVFRENWRAKEYEKARATQAGVGTLTAEEPHLYVEKLREKIQNINDRDKNQAGANLEAFIKEKIIHRDFEIQLAKQGIKTDLFVKELIETNHYAKGPYDLTEGSQFSELLDISGQNYAEHWLGAQIDYYKYLLTLEKNRVCLSASDPEANRVFALNNIFNSTFRNQLGKMGIDENKIVEWVLQDESTEFILKKTKPGRPGFFNTITGKQPDYREPFDYAKQWLKAEIKFLQLRAGPNAEHKDSAEVSSRLSSILEKSNRLTTNVQFKNVILKTGVTKRYTYSHHNIVNRFQCLSTEKDFEKEYPFIHSFMRVYDNWFKRLLVFPLRTISLALALEVMLPVTLPLLTSILIYVSIGLVLSTLIIALEHFSDNYLDELKEDRDKELKNLHKSGSAATFSSLDKSAELDLVKTDNTALRSRNQDLTRSQSTNNLHLLSPASRPVKSSPEGEGVYDSLLPFSLNDSDDNVYLRPTSP